MQLIILFLISTFFSHDMQVATYTLSKEDGATMLYINMESKDLSKVLQLPKANIEIENIDRYLQDNNQFSFNGIKKDFKLLDLNTKAKHFVIKAKFIDPPTKIETIEIWNSCLLEIDDQSNIIQIRLKNQERDFLMNKHRSFIKIEI